MSKRSGRWVVLWTLWLARLVRQPTEPVQVEGGLIRGSVSQDGSHMRYTGVPYAVAPQRFQAPQTVPKWEGVYDAIDEHIRCTQRFSKTWITGYEECLTLNVYTPAGNTEKRYPVMVYIHGGGFRDGSGSPFLYGPEYLIRNDVILVTLNYRLEILGFLCLGIKEAPGNVGLKDQVAALRWVKRNIRAFGGDPDNITLFGESAGSASVLYHVVSPMSKRLFHRAIMESGSAMSPWSLQFEPLRTAFSLAEQMGVKTNDVYEVLELFTKKTAKELLSTRVPRRQGDTILSENIFVPCIENVLPGMEQMIIDSPYNIITRGRFNKVPMIIGYNNAEGFMFVGKENDTTKFRFNFFDSLPRDLVFPTDSDKLEAAETFKRLYFKELDSKNITIEDLSRYEGDSGIVFPVIFTADMLMRHMEKPVFVYKFARDGWMNLVKMLFGFIRYPGATHADELFYIFKPEATLPMSFIERNVIHKMTTMWTNFARFEDPTPRLSEEFTLKWKPINIGNPEILVINTDFSKEPLWNDEAILFWNQTYTKFFRVMILLSLLMLLNVSTARVPTLPVRISSGLVRGTISSDGSHFRYLGIPYANARRFQAPEITPKWNGVFAAVNENVRCPQRFISSVIGDEDCLTLNVYTPTRRSRPVPVMVFIHGGGFRDGSGSPLVYGPDYLVKRDVILVTFNYRLEILGFLCLGIKEAQGNMGLKDQVMALRWVQENISAFGGDPDNVTIFGESAGSVSVLYHILSPASKHLFHKAILESGSAISYWGVQFEPKYIAIKLAQQMGYNTTDEYELLNIFKTKTAAELLGTRVPRAKGDIVQSENIFVPCIEKSLPDSQPFFTDSPYVLLSSGRFNKVPVIIGFNNKEGYIFVGKENKTTKASFNFFSALPRDLQFPDDDVKEETSKKFSKQYSGRHNEEFTTDSLVNYEGDAGIRYPVVATTELLLRNTDKPVYSYKFSYSGLLNFVKILYGFGSFSGASHADELFYLFHVEGTTPLALVEKNMIDKMTMMWTNFAKYANPTPGTSTLLPVTWEAAKPGNTSQLVIDNTLSIQPLWNDEALLLWNETYTKYRRLY
ncbi:unnamed protein product [Leptosia nina]|uniref:Carboxylesterase type B domain-containing protein n=1 Tax=Leptosia nina TaxID=320188 RepID=A0AAV1JXR8_9NEOP